MADLKALAKENFKGILSGILHVLSGQITLRFSAETFQPEQCRIMSYGLKKKLLSFYMCLYLCVCQRGNTSSRTGCSREWAHRIWLVQSSFVLTECCGLDLWPAQGWSCSNEILVIPEQCTVPRPPVFVTEPSREEGRAGGEFGRAQSRDSCSELTEVFPSGYLKYRLWNVIPTQTFSESLFATVQINEHSIRIWSAGSTLTKQNCLSCPSPVVV